MLSKPGVGAGVRQHHDAGVEQEADAIGHGCVLASGCCYCWAATDDVTSIASVPPPRETPRIGAASRASRPEPRRM